MIITYESYMQQKHLFDEQMHATRVQESAQVKAIEEERIQENRRLFDEFVEQKRLNNRTYEEKILEVRAEFSRQRRDIYEKSNRLTDEWRAQTQKIGSGEMTLDQIYGTSKEGGKE